jgi:hypothetical protein
MESLGKYVLLEKIAQGGMAEVFRGVSVGSAGFAKMVAVKRILSHLAAEEHFVGMLIDEAKIACSLIHPNILQVMDLGSFNDVYFIVMEYVVGRSADRIIRAASAHQVWLPQEFSVHVVSQALNGLSYAHAKTDEFGAPMNIVHRDVSPQNIMVSYDGFVKLADFGIARAAERSSHTQEGTIKGKPQYMAPEQVHGAEVDHRLDIYAMGVVLHEMITMRRMRKGESDIKVLMDVVSGRIPRFEEFNVRVPPALAEAVYRALAPDPADRWQDAHSFGAALEEVSRQQGWRVTAPTVSALMHRLFPVEIDAERKAQATFAAELKGARFREMANQSVAIEADGRSPSGSAPRSGPLDVGGFRTPSGSLPRSVGAAGPRTDEPSGASPAPASRPFTLDPATVEVAFSPGALVPPSGAVPAPATAGSGAVAAVTGARPRAGGLAVQVLLGLVVAAGGTYAAIHFTGGARGGAGPLVVESQPPGATVVVNGVTQEGVTPLVIPAVAPGPVEVEARAAGMQPAKEVIVLSPGLARTVRFQLTAVSVQVPVTTRPPGALVSVNGVAAGRAPTVVTLSGAAPVLVRAELEGHAPAEETVSPDAAPRALALTLTPKPKPVAANPDSSPPSKAPPPAKKPPARAARPDGDGDSAPAMGKVSLQSRPWARIYVDGTDTGTFTPNPEMPLTAGKHLIRLVNQEEGLSATFVIEVKPGQVVNVSKELK